MHVRTKAARAGFTLVEVLLASAMGALLLAASASSAGTFAETIAHLDAQSSNSYESVLARIDRDVRYAWSVSVPSRDQLLVTGPDGALTTYRRVGGSLMVTQPDGSSGELVSGLTTFGFTADSLQRLRSGAPATVPGIMGSVPAPGGTPATLMQLGGSTQIALSFMATSNAGARTVAGTNDRITSWTPTSVSLPLAGVGVGTVNLALYPSSGPGRGAPRSGAAALASWTLSLAALPVGAFTLRFGVPNYSPPTAMVSLALPAVPLQPGVAYTLVVNVTGVGLLNLSTYGSTVRKDQVQRNGSGSWSSMVGTLPFIVQGDATCTTTSATNVTTQVRTTIQTAAGDTYVGSACVYSQILAQDPWLGVVPGETPAGS